MSFSNVNKKLPPLQVNAFSLWVIDQLNNGHADIQINDITKDLSDGVALIKLAHILTNKEIPHCWSPSPKQNDEKIKNCNLALAMFKNDGIQLSNISGKDITSNNERIILDFAWSLILNYSIKQSVNLNPIEKAKIAQDELQRICKDALLRWAISRTVNYPGVTNFCPLELAICALIDSYAPNKASFFSLDPKNSKHNAAHAKKVMLSLGITVFMHTKDMMSSEKVDEKVLLTQLAAIKAQLENHPPQQPLKPSMKTNTKTAKEIQNKETSAHSNNESSLTESSGHSSQSSSLNETSTHSNKEGSLTESSSHSSQSSSLTENSGHSNRVIALEADKIVNDNNYYDYEEEEDIDSRCSIEQEFLPSCIQDDNRQFAGKKFALLMTLSESDYNHGRLYKANKKPHHIGKNLTFALTLSKERNAYLNPAGLRLDIAQPNIQKDVRQQFTFGQGEWSTVIDSFARKGMVWDVADNENLNPPVGTQFYLFPFHGRHNQHFIYKDEMIFARQNGMVVTYVGGDEPLVMMPPNPALRPRQTFKILFI
ncbi:alpha-actinin [Tritrichomonas musculus]|uniref:Alpha-actinin n=1 Tax=Tritrichomonas musculus TaxID=1915356 RepID=A0ABR2H691_9EUKA